jgi:hypothetical protein
MPRGPIGRNLAYVSYAPEDNRPPGREWADWIVEALETFEVPRTMAGRPTPFGPIPPRLSPIIKAERSSTEALTEKERQALEEKPDAHRGVLPGRGAIGAVAEEIRFFKQLGRERCGRADRSRRTGCRRSGSASVFLKR